MEALKNSFMAIPSVGETLRKNVNLAILNKSSIYNNQTSAYYKATKCIWNMKFRFTWWNSKTHSVCYFSPLGSVLYSQRGKLKLFNDTLKTGGTVIYFVLLCVFTLSSGKGTQCIGYAPREYFSNLNKWYKINTVIASPPVRQHASAWYSTVNIFYQFDVESNPFASQMFLRMFLFRWKEVLLLK